MDETRKRLYVDTLKVITSLIRSKPCKDVSEITGPLGKAYDALCAEFGTELVDDILDAD